MGSRKGIKDVEKEVKKYPKFILFFATVLIAYFLFQGREILFINNVIISLGYFGVFLAGMLFTYGFTTAFAIALFLMLAPGINIYAAALIGGAGALIGDSFIFLFIRSSFKDEIKKLSREKAIVLLDKYMPSKIKRFVLPVIAGFIIMSPLPDELGISILAASKAVSPRLFAFISYVCNTIGIFVMLLIGQSI